MPLLARAIPCAAACWTGRWQPARLHRGGTRLQLLRHASPAGHGHDAAGAAQAKQAAAAAGAAAATPLPKPSGKAPNAAADERYMRLALDQARLAYAAGEVPVGAVLVSAAGEVLAAEHNRTEAQRDPTAHAEMLCIQQAACQLGAWRLLDATLFVTLEPCPMCAGAMLQSRVGSVVYGARNTLLGADGSWIAVLPASTVAGQPHGGDCGCGECGGHGSSQEGAGAAGQAPAARPARPHPFHPNMAVRRGVLAAECGDLMRSFFARRRQEGAGAVRQAAL